MQSHSTINQNSKRVVLAFRLTGKPGRRKFKCILEHAHELNLDWQLTIVREPEHFSENFVNSLAERRIDGVIISIPTARAGTAALGQLNIPTVALELYDETLLGGRTRNLVYIHGSAEEVGRAAAHNLIAQGCFKSYGFVPDLQGSIWGRLRGAAFVGAIKSAGLAVAQYRNRHKDYDLPQLAAWLRRLPKPVGVFAAYDDRAAQVLEACHEAGLAVPDEVAVIGVDNDETLCTNTTPPLSSVQPDHEAMGRLAVERLAALMGGETVLAPEHHFIGVREIAVRESTSAISNAGRLVQKAMAFIRSHATEAIKPRDVTAYLKVSRSLADLRFRELQGESIGSAIIRQRLEEVKHRLVTTNDSIERIADECHFKRVDRLRDAFKAAYGMTMSEFRRSILPE